MRQYVPIVDDVIMLFSFFIINTCMKRKIGSIKCCWSKQFARKNNETRKKKNLSLSLLCMCAGTSQKSVLARRNLFCHQHLNLYVFKNVILACVWMFVSCVGCTISMRREASCEREQINVSNSVFRSFQALKTQVTTNNFHKFSMCARSAQRRAHKSHYLLRKIYFRSKFIKQNNF